MPEDEAKQIARELVVYLMQMGKSSQSFKFEVEGNGKGEWSVTKQAKRRGSSS